jgi:hypothetical protein
MMRKFFQFIIVIMRNRPRLTFTRGGKVFFVSTVALGIAALNSGNNLLYLVLSMMLSLILSSGVLSSLNLHKIRVKRSVHRYQMADESIDIELTLNNAKKKWPSLGLNLQDAIRITCYEPHVDTPKKEIKRLYIFSIHAKQAINKSYNFILKKRGVYSIQGVRISTQFPFALFEKSIYLSINSKIYVLPPSHKINFEYYTNGLHDLLTSTDQSTKTSATAPSAHLSSISSPQSHQTSPIQTTDMEFSHIRPLQVGEGLKHIHWKASARKGEWMRYVYEDQDQQRVKLYIHPYYDSQLLTAAIMEDDSDVDVDVDVNVDEYVLEYSDTWAQWIMSYYNYALQQFQSLEIYLIDHNAVDKNIQYAQWIIHAHHNDELKFHEWLCTATLSASTETIYFDSDAVVLSSKIGASLFLPTQATIYYSS